MDISGVIDNLRKKYEQSYGFAVFDLEATEKAGEVNVCGRVLTFNQKAEVLAGLRKASGKEIREDIQVLADPAAAEIGWAEVTADTADQKSRFVSNSVINEKIRRRICTSQLRGGEVVRVLFEKEDQLLGQSGDLTLGWIDRKDVAMKDAALKERWRGGVMALAGELVFVSEPAEKLIAEAEKLMGTKYALGAKSEEAIDCSGFTQSVYRDTFGIVLPRHSWDQKEMGVGVAPEEAETGDLVFMTHQEKGTKHVGIWEEPGNILHASRAAGKVVRQSAAEVFARYDCVAIRRIIKKQTW